MKKLFFVLIMVSAVFTAYAQSGGSIPSVIFSANSADLKAVTSAQAISNQQTLTTVAQYLLANPQQRVLIDGHANPVVGTATEERDSLRPLSVRRAEAVANFLVDYYDIARSRIIITGAGGGFPSANNDAAQNRRVSFIYIPPR